jgi:RimJ/RimL family protein N-acetyltransferase
VTDTLVADAPPTGESVAFDWRQGLPVLRVPAATLREPRLADAPAFFDRLTAPPVARYISTPPSSPVGFERFIGWVQHERYLGRHACLAIVPDGGDFPVGLIQLRLLETGFGTADWGFALAEPYWGTGLFMASARVVLDFAFRDLRIHRLEARVSVDNARGNGVLRKLGAVPEGTLREAFANDLHRTDQLLWALDGDQWLAQHPQADYRSDVPHVQVPETPRVDRRPAEAPWRTRLPDLHGGGVTLRELERVDAEPLVRLFADEELRRYIPAPPGTAGDFLRFIQWTHTQRATGSVLCFGVVPDGADAAVGILQIHEREAPFCTAEWGFVLGRPYWGTGCFEQSARLLLQFAFDTLGVQRLEARAMAANARANAVLRRLGAAEEGHLRRSFLLGGEYHDDVLWALLANDWRRSRPPGTP